MKKQYDKPNLEVVNFSLDVITASCITDKPPHCPGDGCTSLQALTDDFDGFLK